jgi:hypothetical protein
VSRESSRCYEVLGVKPGISVSELKAAHRDLAKVWHPDRFGHDSRLQLKAQEKLKEINEAYEQILSGKIPRPRPEPSDSYSKASDFRPERKSTRRLPSAYWVAVPILLFVVVFLFATKSLLNKQTPATTYAETTQTVDTQQAQTDAPNRNVPTEQARSKNRADSVSETIASPPGTSPVVEVRPVSTVTVLIDSASGLLARSDCPTRTRMTYPSGNEPRSYCSETHPVKNKAGSESGQSESRVKSIAKRVVSPGKWLGDSDAKQRKTGTKEDQ